MEKTPGQRLSEWQLQHELTDVEACRLLGGLSVSTLRNIKARGTSGIGLCMIHLLEVIEREGMYGALTRRAVRRRAKR